MLDTNIPHGVIRPNTVGVNSSENLESPNSNNRDFVNYKLTSGTYDTVNFWQSLPPHKVNIDDFTHTLKDGYLVRSKNIIHPSKDATIGITYDHVRQSVLVEIPSLPKLYGKDLTIVAPHDVQNAIDAIVEAISPYVDINPERAVCSRIDPSTAFWMENDARQYIDLLHNCTTNKVGHSHKNVYDGETVVMRNKSTSIGFYDKGLKEHAQHPVNGLLRCEAKLMNTRTVAKSLTDKNHLYLSELASGHTIRKAIELRSRMTSKYFKLDQAKMKQYQDELDFMSAMRSDGKRNAVLKTIVRAALRQDPTLINRIKSQMDAANFTRQAIHRQVSQLNDLQLSAIDARSLYDELLDHIQSELNEAQRIQ